MAKVKKKTKDALQIMHERYFKGKPKRLAELETARVNAKVALLIYNLRTKAGMTQGQLAKLIGTSHSAISRLEDADYEGHSLQMLKKIAAVFGGRVKVDIEPIKPLQKYFEAPNGERIRVSDLQLKAVVRRD